MMKSEFYQQKVSMDYSVNNVMFTKTLWKQQKLEHFSALGLISVFDTCIPEKIVATEKGSRAVLLEGLKELIRPMIRTMLVGKSVNCFGCRFIAGGHTV